MTSGQFVPKKILIDQIQRIMTDGESRVFTVLTDKRRSIMFRFSQGRLIHSHCRSRNVEEAINALNDCTEVKFNQSNTEPKEQAEIIDTYAFLQAITLDEKPLMRDKPVLTAHTPPRLTEDMINPELKDQFCSVARDYIGMVANIVVTDVFAKKLSTDATINEIAASIPVHDNASAFRERAKALLG